MSTNEAARIYGNRDISGQIADKSEEKHQALQASRDFQLDEDPEAMAKRAQKQHKKWNRRMKIFFCCLGYKKNKVRGFAL